MWIVGFRVEVSGGSLVCKFGSAVSFDSLLVTFVEVESISKSTLDASGDDAPKFLCIFGVGNVGEGIVPDEDMFVHVFGNTLFKLLGDLLAAVLVIEDALRSHLKFVGWGSWFLVALSRNRIDVAVDENL